MPKQDNERECLKVAKSYAATDQACDSIQYCNFYNIKHQQTLNRTNPRQYEEVGGEEIHRHRTRGGVGFQCSLTEPEPDDNII
ncbi:hypothetical protein M9H77_00062 [Catharanthus roseus]|nr:hypothetical protein M9H77_00062 [Catharanthus roseus]